MNSHREITFSGTATANLFECLVMSGSPATGYLHAASFRDMRMLQMSLQLLRDMWSRVDGLYIPKSDLETLHAMECKSAGSHTPDIPQCIVVNTRKLARYYIYLLFRYCVSAAEHGLAGRIHKAHTLHLTNIPVSWMQGVLLICTWHVVHILIFKRTGQVSPNAECADRRWRLSPRRLLTRALGVVGATESCTMGKTTRSVGSVSDP